MNFLYELQFTKVGRLITVTGFAIAQNTVNIGATILTIANTDYECQAQRYSTTAIIGDLFVQEPMRVYIGSLQQIKINGSMVQGESIEFTLTYQSLN